MRKNGSSIYGTERCSLKKPDWGYCTQKVKGNKTYVYLQVLDWPEDEVLLFRIDHKASAARLLHNGQTLPFKNTQDGIYITVPQVAPDEIASVIELEFDYVLPRISIKPMNNKGYEIIDFSKG